jgi:CheY-like chemotaxis protein
VTETAEESRPALLLVTGDLLLGSRLRGLAESAGYSVATVPTFARAVALANKRIPDRVLIDLTAPGVDVPSLLSQFGAVPSERVSAYAQHVRVDLLRAARAAGLTAVFTRGQLEAELPRWLG